MESNATRRPPRFQQIVQIRHKFHSYDRKFLLKYGSSFYTTGNRNHPNTVAGPMLGLFPANERRYFATTSLIGWAQA